MGETLFIMCDFILILQHWTRYSPNLSTNKRWPCSRGFHVGSCLIDPESDEAENEQYVAVFWGQGEDAKHVPDIWILHVQKMEWKEVIYVHMYIHICLLELLE